MINLVLKPGIVLSVIFALCAFIIRAQPFDDRALHALTQENCLPPCFMSIRPGITSMRRAVSLVESHSWIARGVGFPAVVRNAVFFDASVPRTRIEWQWSEEAPDWLNVEQPGGFLLENHEAQEITIDTHLSLGEIVLAFGNPDQAQFNSTGSVIEYRGWYAEQGMLIITEPICPLWNSYHAPVRVTFRWVYPHNPDPIPKSSVCR